MTACPHPEKYRHTSERAAWIHADKLFAAGRADLDLRPYPCGDHWHVGHKSKNNQRWQLKLALSAGRKASAAQRRRRRR